MTPRFDHARGRIYEAVAEDVYPLLEDESVSLVLCDGPYAMGQAGWDEMELDELAEWYRPHIKAWGRVCCKSATSYVWGTSASWAQIHPVMLEAGWTFRVLIVWVKPFVQSLKSDAETLRLFPDVTEVCGMYQREESYLAPGTHLQYAAGGSEDNWIREWLASEWKAAGFSRKQADKALGTHGMAGHYFGRSQWALPTREAFLRLAHHARDHGAPHPGDRGPWFTIQKRSYSDTFLHLQRSWADLLEEFQDVLAEAEKKRPVFNLPPKVTNVWHHESIQGAKRLSRKGGGALHPCQKPLAFSRRMIAASSRPGDLVLEPFGGTCRAAVACLELNEDQARRFVCIEPNLDGVDYLGPVIDECRFTAAQESLF